MATIGYAKHILLQNTYLYGSAKSVGDNIEPETLMNCDGDTLAFIERFKADYRDTGIACIGYAGLTFNTMDLLRLKEKFEEIKKMVILHQRIVEMVYHSIF
ncbi:unnamed protein product [Mucor hiemalis]